MKVAHPNLYAFLGHLQRVTVDNQADITRLDRGLRIRRPKNKLNFFCFLLLLCLSRGRLFLFVRQMAPPDAAISTEP